MQACYCERYNQSWLHFTRGAKSFPTLPRLPLRPPFANLGSLEAMRKVGEQNEYLPLLGVLPANFDYAFVCTLRSSLHVLYLRAPLLCQLTRAVEYLPPRSAQRSLHSASACGNGALGASRPPPQKLCNVLRVLKY